MKRVLCILFFLSSFLLHPSIPLYYWQAKNYENFGDYLSYKLVERIVGRPVAVATKDEKKRKLLAIGSIITFASENDVIWGSGINGKCLDEERYRFSTLDVRAVRGPLTAEYLWRHFKIKSPAIYGDPGLLVPTFFPEFQKAKEPKYDYIVILRYNEREAFPKSLGEHIVYVSDPWDEIIEKITDAKFVISSSLHGIIVAEAFGIPAKMLRLSDREPLFKYHDYYLGTNRAHFQYATSIEEALEMGGEPPFECDLEKLYSAFPFELWGKPKPVRLPCY